MHEDLTQVSELKKRLISELANYMSGDLSNVDTHEAGEIVDIIKDLAEIEHLCASTDKDDAEKEYYESVTDAMTEAKYDNILGYTPNPSARIMPRPMSSMRTPGATYEQSMIGDYMRDAYGDFPQGENSGNNRYGQAYKEYAQAKRFYTETHDERDRENMRTQADQHISDMITSVKDIWRNADPDHKKQMKADLTAFVNQLTV